MLGFDFVKPKMKNGQFELDKQGNKIWRQVGITHAVVVNGFGINNRRGTCSASMIRWVFRRTRERPWLASKYSPG